MESRESIVYPTCHTVARRRAPDFLAQPADENLDPLCVLLVLPLLEQGQLERRAQLQGR
ncbi:MAG: hypothetical protein ABI883_08025 [Chthoniobacterales bacterium]